MGQVHYEEATLEQLIAQAAWIVVAQYLAERVERIKPFSNNTPFNYSLFTLKVRVGQRLAADLQFRLLQVFLQSSSHFPEISAHRHVSSRCRARAKKTHELWCGFGRPSASLGAR